MRKKKCLGCGKIFGDKISICQDCFNTIENIRSQFDSMPKTLKKQALVFYRKESLFIGVASIIIILSLVFFLLFLIFDALAESRYNFALLFSLHLFVIILMSLPFGLWIGNVLGKNSITECVKMLSNKDSYLSKAARRKAKCKIFLPFTLSFLVFFLLNESLGSVFIFRWLHLKMIFSPIILGILIGFYSNYYFRMSWSKRLSK